MTGVVERVVAGAGLVVASPLIAACAAGVKWSSPGPAFFRAERVGLGGSSFRILKLRTMHVGSASAGRVTAAADPRVFAFGALLRRLKLDEVPQLVNVVRGEMALVGPRPEDPSIVREHYGALMRETLSVRPGLTSPGSLQYFAAERSLPASPAESERLYVERLLLEKAALDLLYVRNRTWTYDCEILLRTALAVVGLGSVFRRREQRERAAAQRLLDEA